MFMWKVFKFLRKRWASSCDWQMRPLLVFFGPRLTSELCPTGIVTDWTRNSQTPWEGDFVSGRDLNCWPPLHDSSSGGDSVNRLSAIPSVSFRSNSFTICRPSPMLVQKMSILGHGDLDSSGISTSTRLPVRHYKTLPWISPSSSSCDLVPGLVYLSH